MNGPEATAATDANSAAQAEVAQYALWPVRVPESEPWLGHENLDPEVFVPANTQASESPSPSLRETLPLIAQESDDPASNETSGVALAQSNKIENADGRLVEQPQEVIPGTEETYGDLPDKPVPVNDLQRYFLAELIAALGLNAATALNSANDPSNPGNAEALAMAMAQPQAECGFKPRSENLNYSAKRLRQVYPSRVKSDAFAQRLAAAGPPAIGNTLYGGRYGNAQNEGYKYRGRGLIQLTFKSNYEKYSKLAGVPQCVASPDLANDPVIASKLAVAYIKSKSISWTSGNLDVLGDEFRRAVGYANQGGVETARRISLAKGFLSKIRNGELTPLSELETEEAGTNIEAGKGVNTA